jgi:sigma-B regulation protein RsbU (phosphoserine phosphatase)
MANLQAAVRVTIGESDDPAVLLQRWNELICRNTDLSKFITCLLALIDPETRRVHFASAGHHLPLLVSPSQATPRQITAECGFPLGIVEEAEYATAVVDIGPEPWVLFCYTDGVIEAMDTDRKQFGSERLLGVLAEVREDDPQTVVKHVRHQVADFADGAQQSDDITMLAARIG